MRQFERLKVISAADLVKNTDISVEISSPSVGQNRPDLPCCLCYTCRNELVGINVKSGELRKKVNTARAKQALWRPVSVKMLFW